MTAIDARVIPTGGAVGLTLNGSGDWTLSRAVSGTTGISPFAEIGSGTFSTSPGAVFFLDVGDGGPGPLDAAGSYLYQFADADGTQQIGPIMPVLSVNLEPDNLTTHFIRLLQGFVNSLSLPGGAVRPQILHALPLQGWPALPLIVVAPELVQQAEVPIGKDVENPDQTNTWVNTELAQRTYRISVLATNAIDREFYRDAVIGFFKVGLAYFLSQVGQDVRQRYQAASYQVTGDNQSLSPGFYGCDISLEITGTLNISITTSYGLIETITGTANVEFEGVEATIEAEVTA